MLLRYGAFLQSIIDFALIAFTVFIAIKLINRLQRKQAEAPAEPAPPTEEVRLLTEIRDALRTR